MYFQDNVSSLDKTHIVENGKRVSWEKGEKNYLVPRELLVQFKPFHQIKRADSIFGIPWMRWTTIILASNEISEE